MAAKIITFLIIVLANGAAGFSLLFILLLGLNGFNERDAQWSIYLFVAGAVLAAILTGAAGIFLTKHMVETKGFSVVLSVIGSSTAFSAIGILIDVVLMFVGIFLADAIRTGHQK